MAGEYDQEWTVGLVDRDRVTRLRFGLTKEKGHPAQFLVQLEYKHSGTWHPVARFDHERRGPAYRDVVISGLHLDVYTPADEQKRKVTTFQPIDEKQAVPAAERYLKHHYNRLVEEYEQCL